MLAVLIRQIKNIVQALLRIIDRMSKNSVQLRLSQYLVQNVSLITSVILSLVITKACITILSVTQTRHELSFYAVHIRERRRIASSFPFELADLEVAEVIQEIADWANAEVLTMDQYLQPTWNHLPINR